MAYFMNTKNGQKLILTAKDKRIAAERAEAVREATGGRTTVYPYRRDRYGDREIEHFWRWFDYDLAKMDRYVADREAEIERLRVRIQLTRKLEAGLIDWDQAWHQGVEVHGRRVQCTAGYVEDVIEHLDRVIRETKRARQARDAYAARYPARRS